MKHEDWMCKDDRSPERIKADRLRSLTHEIWELEQRLELRRNELKALTDVDRAGRL